MASFNSIEQKKNAYLKSIWESDQRRKQWKDLTRTLLESELKWLAESLKIEFNIQAGKEVTNLETITFSLGNLDSPFTALGKGKPLQLIGGSLAFTQTYNGCIRVYVLAPYIDGLNEAGPPTTLVEEIDPKEINQEFIYKMVENFYDILVKLESKSETAVKYFAI